MASKKSSRKKNHKPKTSKTSQATAAKVPTADQFPHFELPYRGLPSEIRLEIWKYLFPVEVSSCSYPTQYSKKCIRDLNDLGFKVEFGIHSSDHEETNFGSDYLLINKETHQEVKAAMQGGYLFFDVRLRDVEVAFGFAEAIPREAQAKISHFAISHRVLCKFEPIPLLRDLRSTVYCTISVSCKPMCAVDAKLRV